MKISADRIVSSDVKIKRLGGVKEKQDCTQKSADHVRVQNRSLVSRKHGEERERESFASIKSDSLQY